MLNQTKPSLDKKKKVKNSHVLVVIIIQKRVNLDQVKKHVFCTYQLLFNKYPIH